MLMTTRQKIPTKNRATGLILPSGVYAELVGKGIIDVKSDGSAAFNHDYFYNISKEVKPLKDEYTLDKAICKCHPHSACGCAKFMIRKNGKEYVRLFSKVKAEKIVKALNRGDE